MRDSSAVIGAYSGVAGRRDFRHSVKTGEFDCAVYETTEKGEGSVRYWFAGRYPYLVRVKRGATVLLELLFFLKVNFVQN